MSREVHAVIARDVGAPVTLESILAPDPGPDEVLVKVQACGFCSTDPHHRKGRINDDSPFLPGHGSAGVAEAVGERVTNVTSGDFVVLDWQARCRTCRACLRGRPGHCFDSSRTDAVESIRDLTRGIGADAVVDAVGHPETYHQAFYACDLAGTEKILPDGAGRRVREDAPRRGPALSSGAAQADGASRPLSGAFGPDTARRCDRQRRAGRRRTRSCP